MTTALDEIRTPEPPADFGLEVQKRAGVYALGQQTEREFQETVETLKKGLDRLDYIIANILVEGVDYEEPKYADSYRDKEGKERRKKNLLLAGAEKLAFVARLVPTFEVVNQSPSNHTQSLTMPPVAYLVKCSLHMGSQNGPVVAQGVGSCNSYETKYRYRSGERTCPSCQKTGTIRRSKFADEQTGKKGWYCNEPAGGCNTSFKPDDPAIVNQETGRIDNPDPWDLDNTILKMAKTRAFRDAVKTATGGSARLTQDLEDLQPHIQRSGAVEVDEDRPATKGPTPEPVDKPAMEGRGGLINDMLAIAQKKGKTLGDIFALIGVQRGDPQKKPRMIGEMSEKEIQAVIDVYGGE